MSTPSPTLTILRPGAPSISPEPPSWRTSQRSGVHSRGKRPDVSRTHFCRSSTAARFVSALPMRRSLNCTARTGCPGREVGEGPVDERLELRPRDAVPRQAEVGVRHRHGALRRGQRGERAAGGDVLGDEAPPEDDRERPGGRRNAECQQERAARPVAQARPREPERKPDGAKGSHSTKPATDAASPPLNLLAVD